MDLTVDQANLTRTTRLTSRATPTRSTLPVLQTVRLEAQNGGLILTATDLEIGVTTAIAANVATSGTICVPARLLGEYISQLPSEPVHLTLKPEGHRLRLSCGRFVANLATQDATEFPALPAGDEARALTLDASRLRQAVARVAFAAARDEARPVLTAVLFDFGPEGLTLAAADGFRLARARLAGVVADPHQLLVPVRAVTELGRLLGDAETVRLIPTAENRGVHFVIGGTTLFARLLEGHFPDIERVIPQESKTTVTVETAAFRQAVRVAGLFGGSGDSRPVVLEAASGFLHLRARGDQTGDAEADVSAEVAGDPQAIAVNTRLLADLLDVVDSARLRLSWSSAQTPIVLRELDREESADLFVAMPLSDPSLIRRPVAA
ncbi:MAG TPA: DNA polymerase III subunit beta [Chloroflexota bacterium]|nr:DNA polymerase III subunit beta [Chloroflexota bacterium]